MATRTATKPAARNAASQSNAKAAQESAFYAIAPRAYSEAVSRGLLIEAVALTLGKAPAGFKPKMKAADMNKAHTAFAARLAADKVEYLAGRVAARAPDSEFKELPPHAAADATLARIDYARKQVTDYAAPDVDTLPKGKTGRRSAVMHKLIRAAEEAWSKLIAEPEIGIGTAETLKAANAKKRGARGQNDKGGTAPTHTQLVAPEKPKTADEAHAHIEKVAADLVSYANKHAAILCTTHGAAVKAFADAIHKSASERMVRKAEKAKGAHNTK